MPVLTITKSYADGTVLFEADLDAIKDDIENFLNVTKINDDNIQNAGITGSTKLVDASVSSAKIASAAITTSKIDDSAVTTAKIADANITTAKILDANVTTAKIADSNVTTAKIANNAITVAKLAASTHQVSSSSGLFNTTNTSFVDVTNLSVTITTFGNPVYLTLIPDGSTTNAAWIGYDGVANGGYMEIAVVRDSTQISEALLQGSGDVDVLEIPPPFLTIDIPAAGTYTYKVQVRRLVTGSVNVNYCKLFAYEIK